MKYSNRRLCLIVRFANRFGYLSYIDIACLIYFCIICVSIQYQFRRIYLTVTATVGKFHVQPNAMQTSEGVNVWFSSQSPKTAIETHTTLTSILSL